MNTVYVLVSVKSGRYYIGSTSNIGNRLRQHNSGKVFWTRRYKPWELVYTETYNTLSEAKKREYQIKSWKKRRNIENLIKKAAFVADSSLT